MPIFADSDVISLGMLTVTAVLALLTALYVHLTYRILQVQTDPHIVVYLKKDDHNGIHVVVDNIGNGVARDICFAPGAKTDEGTWERILDRECVLPSVHAHVFRSGLPSLPPHKKRVLLWGEVSTIHNAFPSGVAVRCSYKRATGNDDFGGCEKPTREHVLETLSVWDSRVEMEPS
jgi:hypothetical protein